MTDNEGVVNEMVEQAYSRLADGMGKLEAGDKVIIVLARNNDNVVKLIRKISCANGKPLTITDHAMHAIPTVAVVLGTVGLLVAVVALWGS